MRTLKKLSATFCFLVLSVLNINAQASWTMDADGATLSPNTANLAVGAAPISNAKLCIYNNNLTATGTLYSLQSTLTNRNESSTGSLYGLRSTVTNASTSATGTVYGAYLTSSHSNTNGTVYGVYSTVSGGNSSKRWAGYFHGGNVAIMNGNLGIRTSTPTESLDVNGNAIVRGTTQTESLLVNLPNTISDWNNLWQSGFYDAVEDAVGGPEVGAGWFWVLNMGHRNNNPNYRYGGQIAIRNTYSSPTMYFRATKVDGEGVWTKVLHDTGTQRINGDIELPIQTSFRIGSVSDQGYRLRLHHNNISAYIDFSPDLIFRGGDNLMTSLYLTSNGNVGIGLTNPTTKLDVAGIVRAHEVKVCLNQGCDFVFEEDYNLMSISDMAEFVKTNKHLPDVAPAKIMESEGINISEMSALLLRKVEELTLYVIELKNENTQLKTRLDALEK